MKDVLIVGASHVSAGAAYRGLLNRGFRATFLVERGACNGDVLRGVPEERIIETQLDSMQSVLEDLEKLGCTGIHAVTSLTDRCMRMAILLGMQIGALTPDRSLLHLLEKEVVSCLVPEHSPHSIVISVDQLSERISEISRMIMRFGALVVKPSRGSASMGSYYLRSLGDLSTLEAHMRAHTTAGVVRGGWIVQEFVDGPVFSVEGYVASGCVEILGYTFRRGVLNTLTEAHFPGDRYLSRHVQLTANDCLEKLVRRSGYQNGYFHSEFISSVNGAYLIDANFGRVAGGSISLLVASYYGLSLDSLMEHVLGVGVLGVEGRLGRGVVGGNYMGITYGVQSDCVLDFIELPGFLASTHVALCDPGHELRAIGRDGSAWVGIMAGAESDVNHEIDLVRIHSKSGVIVQPKW